MQIAVFVAIAFTIFRVSAASNSAAKVACTIGIMFDGFRVVGGGRGASSGTQSYALRSLIISVGYMILISIESPDLRAQMPYDVNSLSEGAFSARQVERGSEGFGLECMDCHETEEFTGPGAYFEEQEGENLWSVFEFIWAEMPEDKPAWLDPEEYAEILAYLLSVYGFPAGELDLPIDRESLEPIVVTRPERPGS